MGDMTELQFVNKPETNTYVIGAIFTQIIKKWNFGGGTENFDKTLNWKAIVG